VFWVSAPRICSFLTSRPQLSARSSPCCLASLSHLTSLSIRHFRLLSTSWPTSYHPHTSNRTISSPTSNWKPSERPMNIALRSVLRTSKMQTNGKPTRAMPRSHARPLRTSTENVMRLRAILTAFSLSNRTGLTPHWCMNLRSHVQFSQQSRSSRVCSHASLEMARGHRIDQR
jgi:hypothetical protein